MKKILFIFALALIATTINAQEPSAAFQVDATDKGFLMPRVTDHTAISSPAAGLMVYNSTTNKIMVFDGTSWIEATGVTSKFVDGTDPLDAVYTGGKVGIGLSDLSSSDSELQLNSTAISTAVKVEKDPTLLDKFNVIELNGLSSDGTTTARAIFGLKAQATGADSYAYMSAKNTTVDLAINQAGNVGVGVTNPTARLHVNGDIRIIDGTQGADKVLTSDASGLASWQELPNYLSLWTNDTANGYVNLTNYTDGVTPRSGNGVVVFTDTGRVGIGTTNPVHNFVVSSNGANGFEFQPNNPVQAAINTYNRNTSSYTELLVTSASYKFNVIGNNALTIDASSNVGIGTETPGAKLSVVGLQEYADNAAATAGGLSVGDFYRTADGTVKVVF
ncbi:hypothetical protein [Winogradskyella sp.]|uniref:hypothetical protein n=1 Tax=Winogradskyella sp. TaxID=1883156 RepID=UPI00261A932E|nr:hypothetical protein [Winogradskyella sp.]